MQPAAILLVSVLAATGAAVGTTFALRSNEPPPSSADDLQKEVASLRAQNTELTRRVDALANASPAVATPIAEDRTAVATVSDEQIAAAVEAYLHQHAGSLAGVAANAAAKPDFDLARDLPKLVGTNYWGNTEAWKRAFAAGQMDAVIGELERQAKANPNDVKTQMSLASAYMAYLQMDQSKWQYSMKADGVYDKVLALDPTHWEARFTKAVSYTFYPDFLGKKPDAIKNFETLVAQQDTMPVEASQAQTYLYLGNLLQDRDPARAKEVWQKGARRHPDNAELQKKAGL